MKPTKVATNRKMELPSEIAKKLPKRIQSKVQFYLSHKTSDIIKELFKDNKYNVQNGLEYGIILKTLQKLKKTGDVENAKKYKEMKKHIMFNNIVSKRMVSNLYSFKQFESWVECKSPKSNSLLLRSQVTNDFIVKAVADAKAERYYKASIYPEPGFKPGFLPFYSLSLPSIKWKHEELLQLARGLSPKTKKSWPKKKLLQTIYPNLHFIHTF